MKKPTLYYLISCITDGAWGIYATSDNPKQLGQVAVSELTLNAESQEGWFLRELLKNVKIVSEKEARKYGIVTK